MGDIDDALLGVAPLPQPALDGPPREMVRAAIRKAREDDPRGRIMKVLFLDDAGHSVGEWASSQIPENPWDGQTLGGLQEPPYRMEQMTFLAEMHPVHSSALDQKTQDICGKGWDWQPVDEKNADEMVKDEMEAWVQSLSADDEDTQEILSAVWLDVETVGWGLFECVRDPNGVLQRIYHVPGHTVRAHRNGFALCQVRDQRKVWFRRWGAVDLQGKRVDVDMKSGSINSVKVQANDMFVIRRNARRSTWYGIPSYISAVGWITLAMAARDDNLLFFANRREPRWAIVLNNLTDDPDLEEDLRRAFTVDLRQPYRNLIIPIQGPGKVDFQKLSDTAKDGSFDKLSDHADRAIMIAHRVPAGRIANAQIGPLGGNNTIAENRIYADGVVTPGQELYNSRLNKFISIEYPKFKSQSDNAKPLWKLALDNLDVSSEREDLDWAAIAFHGNMITLREARAKLRYGPLMKPAPAPIDPTTGQPAVDPVSGLPLPPPDAVLDPDTGEPVTDPETGDPLDVTTEVESPYNDMLFTELPGAAGTAGSPAAPPVGSGGVTNPNPNSIQGMRDAAIAEMIHRNVSDLLTSAQENQEVLEELTRLARSSASA